MIHDPHAPGVVLSPHPDDAVLSAWSVLCSPGDVTVVTICAGVPPNGTRSTWDRVMGIDDSAALTRTRRAEDVAALALAGRVPVQLDFLDEPYRKKKTPLRTRRVGSAISEAVPSASRLYVPAGLGQHPDHVAVREAGLTLARDASIPITLYADLPYAVWVGWPPWVTGAAPRPYLVPEARWQADLAGASVAWEDLIVQVCALDDVESARKLAALRLHETQFELLNAGAIRRLENPEIIGFEVRWDVSSR